MDTAPPQNALEVSAGESKENRMRRVAQNPFEASTAPPRSILAPACLGDL
jgi:hypothetical protein